MSVETMISTTKQGIIERIDNMLSTSAVIVDVETTGLDDDAEIIELAILSANEGRTILSTYVRPLEPIDKGSKSFAVNGICDEMLDGAPTFAELVPQLAQLLNGRTVIAYNSAFDRRMMAQELGRITVLQGCQPGTTGSGAGATGSGAGAIDGGSSSAATPDPAAASDAYSPLYTEYASVLTSTDVTVSDVQSYLEALDYIAIMRNQCRGDWPCAMYLYMDYAESRRYISLRNACMSLGVPESDHTALGDCIATRRVLRATRSRLLGIAYSATQEGE